MPTYTMRDNNTNEVFDIRLTMTEREKYLQDNQCIEQIFTSISPAIGDSVRLGVHKLPESFKDVLRKARDSHYKSNIDV